MAKLMPANVTSFSSSSTEIQLEAQGTGDRMGRGVSAGGGQSSLGYLFGSGEAPKPAINNVPAPPSDTLPVNSDPSPKPVAAQPVDVTKQIPAGTNNSSTNNYMRADGQNTGNFLTDRPLTKVHAAPGGGSSLDYLFGGGGNN